MCYRMNPNWEKYYNARIKVRRVWDIEPEHSETVSAKTNHLYRSTCRLNNGNRLICITPAGFLRQEEAELLHP